MITHSNCATLSAAASPLLVGTGGLGDPASPLSILPNQVQHARHHWYLKSYEAMAGHRFNFTTLPAEPNVWGALGSGRGTVSRRLSLFAKASSWLQERIENPLAVVGPEPNTPRRRALRPGTQAYVVEGSSEKLSLPSASADLVLTDPPYHDDVQYDELSMPFRAWSQLSTRKLTNEAVVNATNGFATHSNGYSALLSRIFRECQRVLKPTGRLILSYANRQSTTSISRRRAASNSFSRASRLAAPEFTSRTCQAIVQPRRAAYSRIARFCIARVCWSLVETRAYSPARNIFGRLRAWPKTCSDWAF
jgi:hypothetical protein